MITVNEVLINMIPKEAKDAVKSLEHMELEIREIRRSLEEFKILLAQQNSILNGISESLKSEDGRGE